MPLSGKGFGKPSPQKEEAPDIKQDEDVVVISIPRCQVLDFFSVPLSSCVISKWCVS